MTRLPSIIAASVAAAGALALSACGSSGSSGNAGTAANTSTTSSAVSSSTTASTATSTAATGSSSSATSGTGALPNSPGSVTVGSADFPENELLADIYGDAMAAKGVKVSKHVNIGERSVYIAALKDGSIGFIPEYSGSILDYLDPSATAKSPTAVYQALQGEAAKSGFTVLKPAAAQDADTITVTKTTASKDHLKSIADLKPVAGNLTLGAPAQFRTRPDGVPALKSVYGVVFGNFVPLNAGGLSTVQALTKGTVQAADIFSTDPSIQKYHLVSLTDPKNMFASQEVTPMFSSKVLTKPMKDACDAVSAKLTTTMLAKMVAQVAGGQDADAVAKQWLSQQHLR